MNAKKNLNANERLILNFTFCFLSILMSSSMVDRRQAADNSVKQELDIVENTGAFVDDDAVVVVVGVDCILNASMEVNCKAVAFPRMGEFDCTRY